MMYVVRAKKIILLKTADVYINLNREMIIPVIQAIQAHAKRNHRRDSSPCFPNPQWPCSRCQGQGLHKLLWSSIVCIVGHLQDPKDLVI